MKQFILISALVVYTCVVSAQELNYNEQPLEIIHDSLNIDSIINAELMHRFTPPIDINFKNKLPATYEQFKREFLTINVNTGSIEIPGLPKAKPGIPTLMNDKAIKSPLFAIMSPVSFLYYNLSKEEISKRKHYRLSGERKDFDMVDKKINREKLMAWTGIKKDEELDKFILFCDFSVNYLRSVNEYDLIVKVKEKYKEFQDINKPLNLFRNSCPTNKVLFVGWSA